MIIKRGGNPKPWPTLLAICNGNASAHEPLPFELHEHDIFKQILPSLTTSTSHWTLDIVGRSEVESSMFTCIFCLCILSNPVESPCNHNFCSPCLTRYFQYHRSVIVPCPVCQAEFGFQSIKSSPHYVVAPLPHLLVLCSSCGIKDTLQNLHSHKCNKIVVPCPCTKCVAEPTPPTCISPTSAAAAVLAQRAVKHKKGDPIPPAIERMADRWMHRKIQASADSKATIRTGGMPMKIQKVVTPRKSSQEVTKSYQNKRSSAIKNFANNTNLEDTDVHCHLGSPSKPTLDVDDTIAMSRQMHSTWENLSVLRRYMSKIKVNVASERQMRRRRAELLQDPLEAVLIPLVFHTESADGFDGLIQKETPYVFVKDLPNLIFEFLERHDELGNLTTHDGMIPDDEIWVKIGGDRGGSSMKMFAQIVNIEKPNSASNTIIFAAFNASDSAPNMSATMDRFIPQLEELQKMTWRNKKFRLYFFGDCDLICRIYGILSCNAVFACPVCEESRNEWQKPPNQRTKAPLRTLSSIRNNYSEFLEDGGGTRRSKLISKSVVRPPLFPIEPENIAMPTLHIGLGVFKKIYDKLEEDSDAIDQKIFRHRVRNPDDEVDEITNFDQAIHRRIKQRATIKKRQEEIEEAMDNIQDHPRTKAEKKTLESLHQSRQEIYDMEEKLEEFSFRSGPITAGLDRVLNSHGIARQQYHGRAFIGNHVSKGCQSKVYSALVAAPLEAINSLDTDNLPITVERDGERIKMRYTELFSSYAAVHSKINHGRTMTVEEIAEAEKAVEVFMENFRRLLPSVQISLKLHFLEDHTIPQMKKIKAGLGKMNEQGGEASHNKQNKIEAQSANMKKQPLRHLLTVMTNALTAVLPDVQSNMLYRKKRKGNGEE